MEDLHARYADRAVRSVFIYTHEAHPGENYRHHTSMDDKRANWQECQLCDNSDFHPGTVCRINGEDSSGGGGSLDPEAEKLVQQLTDQIVSSMK